IGLVIFTEEDAVLAGRDDDGRTFQLVIFNDERLAQEWLDQAGRNGLHRILAEALHAQLRGKLVVAGATIGVDLIAEAQAACSAVEPDDLAWINPVRIGDLFFVHAPYLRPAPGLLE